jgi:formylmethanofuran dehydrogenase subunit A
MHDGHEHDHGGHSHTHTHAEHAKAVPATEKEKLVAMVGYMLDHNRAHAAELLSIADKIEELGFGADAAAAVRESSALLSQGADRLAAAEVSISPKK